MIAEALTAAAKRYPIPSFVVAATRDGEMIHASAHGVRDADTGAPLTMDTVFRLYSMTKAVTAAAVLQLVDRGAIALDAPASQYASELANIQVLAGFDDDWRAAPAPAGACNHDAPLCSPTQLGLATRSGTLIWCATWRGRPRMACVSA